MAAAGESAAAVVLEYGAQPMDCALHPSEPVLAVPLVSGRLVAHRFDTAAGTAQQAFKLKAHSESCRAAHFSPDGKLVVTASADQTILAVDAATGKAAARMTNAHPAGIDRLMFVSDTCLASGDQEGGIKLWDTRQQAGCGAFDTHTDYISAFAVHDKQHALLATSGDGTLSVNDLRKNKVLARSEDDAEEELLSLTVIKRGKKVVAGASDGVLNIFSWGYWNGCSDRLPGHPAAVDCMVAVDDSTVATGSSDGFIRLIGIQPHKMLGVIGSHGSGGGAGGKRRREGEEGDPVEALALSASLQLLASAGHDNTVRLWSLAEDDSDDEEAAGDGIENSKADAVQDAAAGENGDGIESDDSDSDNEPKQKRKRRANKGAHKINRKAPPAAKSSFFSDL